MKTHEGLLPWRAAVLQSGLFAGPRYDMIAPRSAGGDALRNYLAPSDLEVDVFAATVLPLDACASFAHSSPKPLAKL